VVANQSLNQLTGFHRTSLEGSSLGLGSVNAMLPNGHTPKVTRLSKALSALLVLVFAVDFFVPAASGYLALVPGRWDTSTS
jgi:hypothetical protein